MGLGATCGMAHTFLVHRKLYIHCKAGPFTSSNREAGFLPKDKGWQHEDASLMMFDDMMKQYDLDIPPDEVQFIKALIAGESGEKFRCRSAFLFIFWFLPCSSLCSDEKPFLFEIVANKRNGIDVDK
jgi:hypothetical protein